MNEIHKKYLEVLPEINETKYYGESTKLIRQKLDKTFGNEKGDVLKKYEVEVRLVTVDYEITIVEAYDEDDAEAKALEEFSGYDDPEIWEINEIED